ncbi:AAA family ATPase [bacterium]|nr:AAA family ATPase [bacterium]
MKTSNSNTESSDSELDLRKVVKFITVYFKHLIIFAVLGGIAGYSLSKMYPKNVASAKLHVRQSASGNLGGLAFLTGGSGKTVPGAVDFANRLQSFNFSLFAAKHLIKQPEITTTYYEYLRNKYQEHQSARSGAEGTPAQAVTGISDEWFADYLLAITSIQVEGDTYIRLKTTTPFGELSHYLTNEITKVAVEYLQIIQRSESNRARSYIEDKIHKINSQREELSSQLKKLRTKSEFFGGSVQESGFFGLGIEDIKNRLHETQLSINENLKHIGSLEKIATTRNLTLSESTILENLGAENEILDIKVRSLVEYLDKNKQKKSSYADALSGFQLLSKELDLFVSLYAELSKQQVTLELDYLSLADRISIFENSRLRTVEPMVPFSIAVLGGIVAFFLFGIGLSILHSTLFPSIISLGDLSVFDIGQLGTLPKISARHKEKITDGGVSKGFPEQFESNVGQRAFKNLRRSLLNVIDVKKFKKVVVSSPHASNGKSTIVFNLSLGLASIDKKILVVDSDIVHPNITKRFGLNGKNGITDLISGYSSDPKECVHTCRISQKSSNGFNVDVLPIGKSNKNHAMEIANSKVFSKTIEELADSYDLILIDTPPILASTDGNEAIKIADMIVLSLVYGATKVTDVMATLQNMPPRKHESTYAVLNFVPRWNSEETSSYYYSYLETNTKRKKKGPSTWKSAA